MEELRAFGVSMCTSVMRTLPQVPEETIHRCLREISAPVDTINATALVEIEEEVWRQLIYTTLATRWQV